MQDLVDKLQSKVKSYKRQFEEAVSTLGVQAPGASRDARGELLSPAELAAREASVAGCTEGQHHVLSTQGLLWLSMDPLSLRRDYKLSFFPQPGDGLMGR